MLRTTLSNIRFPGDIDAARGNWGGSCQCDRQVKQCAQQLVDELSKVIVGQEQVIEELLISLFSRGHCLLEGVPGLAKTLMVSTLARAMHLSFSRIQFTPDLMPADITGTEVLEENRTTGARDAAFWKGRCLPT